MVRVLCQVFGAATSVVMFVLLCLTSIAVAYDEGLSFSIASPAFAASLVASGVIGLKVFQVIGGIFKERKLIVDHNERMKRDFPNLRRIDEEGGQ